VKEPERQAVLAWVAVVRARAQEVLASASAPAVAVAVAVAVEVEVEGLAVRAEAEDLAPGSWPASPVPFARCQYRARRERTPAWRGCTSADC